MKEMNFYPGPSRVYDKIPDYVREAYMDGILSVNHRSGEFMSLMEQTKKTLREKLLIPGNYEIAFTSSATETWEIIAQSLTEKGSQHFFNGSFGEKWTNYAGKIVPVKPMPFGIDEQLPACYTGKDTDVLCVTQNETSNATQVPMSRLKALRANNEGKIIAVDTTSSMGGIMIDYGLADVWYASVQKCLGLPAGMGLLILSPNAVNKAEKIGDRDRYNSLLQIVENSRKNQTPHTPNVLSVYLLNRTQSESKGIVYTSGIVQKRYRKYAGLFERHDGFRFLTANEAVRASTVLALRHHDVPGLKSRARENGMVLGNGYGPWKNTTFRIANFPAVHNSEVEKLIAFLGDGPLRG